jgi:hypothetical protein
MFMSTRRVTRKGDGASASRHRPRRGQPVKNFASSSACHENEARENREC